MGAVCAGTAHPRHDRGLAGSTASQSASGLDLLDSDRVRAPARGVLPPATTGTNYLPSEVLMLKLQVLRKAPRRRRCEFTLDASAAASVAVTGDFCDWDLAGRPMTRGPDDVWWAALLLAPGRYEYRFRLDGAWADDPACTERVPNGFGSENCVLRVGPESPRPRRSPMFSK